MMDQHGGEQRVGDFVGELQFQQPSHISNCILWIFIYVFFAVLGPCLEFPPASNIASYKHMQKTPEMPLEHLNSQVKITLEIKTWFPEQGNIL